MGHVREHVLYLPIGQEKFVLLGFAPRDEGLHKGFLGPDVQSVSCLNVVEHARSTASGLHALREFWHTGPESPRRIGVPMLTAQT